MPMPMRHHRLKTKLLAPCLWLPLMLSAQPSGAEIYQYIDADGTIHLSNVPADPRYRRVSPTRRHRPPRLAPAEVDRLVARHARQHDLPPALLRAVIKTESDFNPLAVSRAGAIGLMQLMPQTALMLNVRNPFDPEQNVRGGAAHLRALLDRFEGNLTLALGAYNAGVTAVEQYNALPPYRETRRFVWKVLRNYRQFLAGSTAAPGGSLRPFWASTPQHPLGFSDPPAR